MRSNPQSSRSSSVKDDSKDDDIEKKAVEDQPESAQSRGIQDSREKQNQQDPNLVQFDGPDDPENPMNWSRTRKFAITASMGWMTFVVTFASSIFSVAIEVVSQEFEIGTVVSTLGVALFVLGFVFGPVFFGPASEVYGRRIPLFSGYIIFAIFQIPVAVATNVETIMLGRFFGGFFASAPLAADGGALADIWNPIDRAYAICAFAAGAFSGPVAGPILGGFVTESYLGWRWTAWFTLILAALMGGIGFLTIPETSAPKILQAKAKRLRFEKKNFAIHAPADEIQVDLNSMVTKYLVRPFKMMATEPILSLMTAYLSFLYGIVYLLFEAFPISFYEGRGWSLGVSSLPFAAFIIGIAMGATLMAYSTATNFKRSYIKYGRVIP